MSPLTIKVATGDELNLVYDIREAVFQREMGVRVVDDFDGNDYGDAKHVLAYVGHCAVGTARWRLLYDGAVKVERVAVLYDFRKRDIGRSLMRFAENALQKDGHSIVIVHAQEQVKQFYLKLGYIQQGAMFKEVDLLHIRMSKKL